MHHVRPSVSVTFRFGIPPWDFPWNYHFRIVAPASPNDCGFVRAIDRPSRNEEPWNLLLVGSSVCAGFPLSHRLLLRRPLENSLWGCTRFKTFPDAFVGEPCVGSRLNGPAWSPFRFTYIYITFCWKLKAKLPMTKVDIKLVPEKSKWR